MMMRCILLTFAAVMLWSQAPKYEHDIAIVEELRARDGLPNVFAKLAGGKETRIAYLGGSITAAGGSEDTGGGWRGKSLAWFKKEFPSANIIEINAAIGGTGSDYGAFRIHEHVLKHNPDIVFVEFRVNGGGAAELRSVEGIVRQIWNKDPSTDICFVYTLSHTMLPTIQAGSNTGFGSVMERIANHYGIPSVDYGPEVSRLEKEGALIFKGKEPAPEGKILFSTDGVHPLIESGHNVYKTVITRSLAAMKETGTAGKHITPEAIDAMNWEKAKMANLTDVALSGGWFTVDMTSDPIASRFKTFMPTIVKCNKIGESITLKFNGTVAGAVDLVGPNTGQIKVSVDGQPSVLRQRFDHYCTYHRTQFFFLPELPAGDHTVRFEIAEPITNKAEILKRNGNKIDDPNRYADNMWYVGSFMILGDIDPSFAGKFKLPPAAPKERIDYDFENEAVGTRTAKGGVNEEGAGTIRITDAAAAGGTKSLMFTDTEGIKPYNPHLFYSMNYTAGKIRISCDVMNSAEKPAQFEIEARDYSQGGYITGPKVTVTADGALTIGTAEAGALAKGQWSHIEMVFAVNGAKTFDCTITGGASVKKTVPFVSEKFKALTWFGFISSGTAAANWYIDNVKIDEVQ